MAEDSAATIVVPEYEAQAQVGLSDDSLDAPPKVDVAGKKAGTVVLGVVVIVVLLFLLLAAGDGSGGGGSGGDGVPADLASEIAAEEAATGVAPLESEGCSAAAARARQIGHGGLLSAAVPGETSEHTLSVDGVDRSFRLHLPAGYLEAAQPLPLLFDFHGWGSSSSSQEGRSRTGDLADQLPPSGSFIVVYPDAMGDINSDYYDQWGAAPGWNGGGCSSSPGPAGETCALAGSPAWEQRVINYGAGSLAYDSCSTLDSAMGSSDSMCNCCSCADDIGFVRAMLQQLQTDHCVDRRRVYATGMSYGGLFAYQLALSLPHVFAAVAPVAGGILKGFATPPAGPAATNGYIGVLDIHGW